MQILLIESESGRDSKTNFKLVIIQTELERVKYLVRSYIRVRIHKIDKHLLYVLRNTEMWDRLSQDEIEYAQKHFSILQKHYQVAFMRDLPENLQKLDDKTGGLSMSTFLKICLIIECSC